MILQKISGFRSTIINALIDAVAACRPIPGPGLTARETPAGTIISLVDPLAKESPFPYGAIHPWGIVSLAKNKITVAAGAMEVGDIELESIETTITLSGLGQFIWLEYSSSGSTLTVTGPHAAKPIREAGYYRTWLYCLNYANNSVTLLRQNLTGLRMGQPW